jgi:hypothetical protein
LIHGARGRAPCAKASKQNWQNLSPIDAGNWPQTKHMVSLLDPSPIGEPSPGPPALRESAPHWLSPPVAPGFGRISGRSGVGQCAGGP